jgi:hypothetical protein
MKQPLSFYLILTILVSACVMPHWFGIVPSVMLLFIIINMHLWISLLIKLVKTRSVRYDNTDS